MRLLVSCRTCYQNVTDECPDSERCPANGLGLLLGQIKQAERKLILFLSSSQCFGSQCLWEAEQSRGTRNGDRGRIRWVSALLSGWNELSATELLGSTRQGVVSAEIWTEQQPCCGGLLLKERKKQTLSVAFQPHIIKPKGRTTF